MGDPAGIGPLVTVAALHALPELLSSHRVVVVGCHPTLEGAAARLGLTWNATLADPASPIAIDAGELGLIEPPGASAEAHEPGVPTLRGGALQVAAIDIAAALVMDHRADAIVTGPVSKIAITRAGVPFSGHTEHLARAAGVSSDAVTMMFAGPKLKIALTTTHLPIRDVSGAVSVDRLLGTIRRVAEALFVWWGISRPRVVVLGLNPHAGEEGLIGDEETTVIAPAVDRARELIPNAAISGPVPSEVGLRRALEGAYDAVIAHYHDQATIPSKLIEMGRAVNVTLGLPFIRTSVDHGVAYDAAMSGVVDSGSMAAALMLAASLTLQVVAGREQRGG